MNKYIFILGNNPTLSQAEIMAFLPHFKKVGGGKEFIVMEGEEINCPFVMSQLGGTIKIAQVINTKIDQDVIIGEILKRRGSSKVNFGFSFYDAKPTHVGMDIKTALKERGISCRLVVSREKNLSSVIIAKNKCLEFIVTPDAVAVTCAVQDFEDYSRRDYGRPASDSFSGMLPPKVAKMMINLAQLPKDKILLDPFCGSGTILTEALIMGYTKIAGTDVSEKAVDDSEKNVAWVAEKYDIQNCETKIAYADARTLSQKIPRADAIVTEPYLGPALRGNPRDFEIRKIVSDIEKLYSAAFGQFAKILPAGGRVVMVFPQWHLQNGIYDLRIAGTVMKEGFRRIDRGDLIYKRLDQKVWRNITVWEKVATKKK